MRKSRMGALVLALLLPLNVTSVRAQSVAEVRHLAATKSSATKVFALGIGPPCSGASCLDGGAVKGGLGIPLSDLPAITSGAQLQDEQTIEDEGWYRVADYPAYSMLPNTCNDDAYCTYYGTNNGEPVNTSDYGAVQYVYVAQPSLPTSTTVLMLVTGPYSLVAEAYWYWTSETGCWTYSYDGSQLCSGVSTALLGLGPQPLCGQAPIGQYTMYTFYGTNATGYQFQFSHTFNLLHNPGGPLAITSPLDPSNPPQNPQEFQLFQLLSPNFNSTGPITFSAGTFSPYPLTWNVGLHYQSSANLPYPPTDPVIPPYYTLPPYNTYSFPGFPVPPVPGDNPTAGGGHGFAEATATLPDGGVVNDCVHFFVEGPESCDNNSTNNINNISINNGGLTGCQTGSKGIPGGTINPVLKGDYTGSSSYMAAKYLNNMGTSTLMAGVARHEDSCRQFVTPLEELPKFSADILGPWVGVPLWGMLGIPAKWPTENSPIYQAGTGKPGKPGKIKTPKGVYIGMLQYGGPSHPFTDPDAWDWTINAEDAINSFSGGNNDDVQEVVNYENDTINGKNGVPARTNEDGTALDPLTSQQREDNALVLYSGNLGGCGYNLCTANKLYYIPVCTGTIIDGATLNKKHKRKHYDGEWFCYGGDWVWTPNLKGLPSQTICPEGVPCPQGQNDGILYVTNPDGTGARDYADRGGCPTQE